jgi:hypothetical protein
MLNGWQPKLKLSGPVPLSFDSPLADQVVAQLALKPHPPFALAYLGPRPRSSFDLHLGFRDEYASKAQQFQRNDAGDMAAFFRKFYSHFTPKAKRPFEGMAPGQHLVTFDSSLQSGNLDAAVRSGEAEYDLFIRNDSNTRGHSQWYYFRTRCAGRASVRFNIVNLRKRKTLYARGMKPYCLSYLHLQRSKQGWQQGPYSATFKERAL